VEWNGNAVQSYAHGGKFPLESEFGVVLVGCACPVQSCFLANEFAERPIGQFHVMRLEINGEDLDVQYEYDSSSCHPKLLPQGHSPETVRHQDCCLMECLTRGHYTSHTRRHMDTESYQTVSMLDNATLTSS